MSRGRVKLFLFLPVVLMSLFWVFSSAALAASCETSDCHGTDQFTLNTGSHQTHIDTSGGRGPRIATCDVCHGIAADAGSHIGHQNGITNFIEGPGSNLANTVACNMCHSPAGGYDGVNSLDIGAKPNWAARVYYDVGIFIEEPPSALKPGKEKWCVGCHDSQPSVIMVASGTGAPSATAAASNIAGDGVNYGYYVAGHGKPIGMYDQNSLGDAAGNSAANKACGACHNDALNHIDGYDGTSVVAQRLRSSLEGTSTNNKVEGVCKACHQQSSVAAIQASGHGNDDVGSTGGGNNYQKIETAYFNTTCEQCHDPHSGKLNATGTRNLRMIRPDVVVNKSTGIKAGMVFKNTAGSDSYDEIDAVDSDDLCAACHTNVANPGYPMVRHGGGDHRPAGPDMRGGDCTPCHSHNYGNDGVVRFSDGFMVAGALDTLPPNTSVNTSPSAPNGDNGWFKTVPAVLLSADEPGTTYYMWETTGTWQPYTGGFPALLGTNVLDYFSVDTAGNTETVKSQLFKVDTVLPANLAVSSPSHTIGGTSLDNTIDMNITGASDAISGVDGFSYAWSQSITTTPDAVKDIEESATSVTSPALTDGTWYFHLQTKDNAGNWSAAAHSGPYTVASDITPPSTFLFTAPSSADGDNGWFKTIPTITMAPNETATTYYQWETTGTWQPCMGTFAALLGMNTLNYYSADTAGNAETAKNQQFKVDISVPNNPSVSSPSHAVGGISRNSIINMDISGAADTYSGVDGFSVEWSQGATTTPDATKDMEEGAVSITSAPLADGSWYFHLRTKDNAGNWSAAVHSGPYVIVTPLWASRHQESSPGIRYGGNWSNLADASSDGGASQASEEANADSTLYFSGTQVKWIGKKANDMGKADVIVDGVYVATVDQYANATGYKQVVFDSGRLVGGIHTFRIVVTGTKRTKSSGVTVDLDAVDVVEESGPPTPPYRVEEASVDLEGTWLTAADARASGGQSIYSDQLGASTYIGFYGTQFKLVGKKAPNMGKADIYIGAVRLATVDQYSRSAAFQQTIYSSPVMTYGSHVVRVSVLRQKKSASSGYFVDVDAFDITP